MKKSEQTDLKKLKKKILLFLKENADPRRQVSTQRFFPEPIDCYGVSLPRVRKFCRQLNQETGQTLSEEALIELVKSLLEEKKLESEMAGLFLLSCRVNQLESDSLEYFENWLRRDVLDNWALLDTFSLEIISPLLFRYPKMIEKIKSWVCSDNVYLKRAGLVALIKPVRKKLRVKSVLQLTLKAMSQPPAEDGLVAKAAGWLLREIGKVAPGELKNFLIKNGRPLPRVTVRYAVERFSREERDYFLKITKN